MTTLPILCSVIVGITSTLLAVLASRPGQAWLALRREGMDRAVLDVAGLIDGHGLAKHGVRRWKSRSLQSLRSSAFRHLHDCEEIDESGYPHAVHCTARALQLVEKTRRES